MVYLQPSCLHVSLSWIAVSTTASVGGLINGLDVVGKLSQVGSCILTYICKSTGESFLPDPDLVIASDEALELQSAHLYLCDFLFFYFFYSVYFCGEAHFVDWIGWWVWCHCCREINARPQMGDNLGTSLSRY